MRERCPIGVRVVLRMADEYDSLRRDFYSSDSFRLASDDITTISPLMSCLAVAGKSCRTLA